MIYNEIIKFGKSLCFDVGANIGNRTSIFINIGYEKVIAIEPQRNCLSILKNKFENNHRVLIIDKALSEVVKTENMYISNSDTISSMDINFINEVKKDRFKNYKWDICEEVETTTLDNLINLYGIPDFIKIDVEGYELNVLKGLSKPVNCISFEYTPELHDRSILCVSQLESISNYVYNLSIGESLLFEFDEWVSKEFLDSWLRENMMGKRDINNNLLFGDIYAKIKINI
jgi:FkbM family methyltransferase